MALFHPRLGHDIGNLIRQLLHFGRFLIDVGEGMLTDSLHVISSSEA
jgi:hypothetical protein